ncbi:ATP-binding protein, partial [Enterococcus faecalis]|uniref:ATP-binding protein n=1 Tax=Enterococcus faecalis TaxID=1351 RepID=UPI003D6A4507
NKQGIYLCLKDSGIGIRMQDLRRIFDKGFSGENGRKSEQHSTGLGLYLAHSLPKKLGHDLTVESTEGQGTTMTLFFTCLSYYNEVK